MDADHEDGHHPAKRRKLRSVQNSGNASCDNEYLLTITACNIVFTSPKRDTASLRLTYGTGGGVNVYDEDNEDDEPLAGVKWDKIEEILSLEWPRSDHNRQYYILIPKQSTAKKIKKADFVPIIWYVAADCDVVGNVSFSDRSLGTIDGEYQSHFYHRILNAGLALQGKEVQIVEYPVFREDQFGKPGRGGKYALPGEQIFLYGRGGSFRRLNADFPTGKSSTKVAYIAGFPYGCLITDLGGTTVWMPSQSYDRVEIDISKTPTEITLARKVGSEKHWVRFAVNKRDEHLVEGLLLKHTSEVAGAPSARGNALLTVKESLERYLYGPERRFQDGFAMMDRHGGWLEHVAERDGIDRNHPGIEDAITPDGSYEPCSSSLLSESSLEDVEDTLQEVEALANEERLAANESPDEGSRPSEV